MPTTSTLHWNAGTTPVCSVSNGGEATKCEIITESRAKVTFAAMDNLVLHGTISNFVNPHSVKPVAGLQARLYSKFNTLKVMASSLSLNTIEVSSMDVELSSSSNLVGAKGQTLKMQIDPW